MTTWKDRKKFMELADAYQKKEASLKQEVEQAKAELERYEALVQTALDRDAIDETTAVYQLKARRAEQVRQQREQALKAFQEKPLLNQEQVKDYWSEIRSFYAKRCSEKKQAADKCLQKAMEELGAVDDIRQEANQAANEFKTVCSASGVDTKPYKAWEMYNSIGRIYSIYKRELEEIVIRFARS